MKFPVYVEYAFGYRKIEDEETYLSVDNDGWEQGILRLSEKKSGRLEPATFEAN